MSESPELNQPSMFAPPEGAPERPCAPHPRRHWRRWMLLILLLAGGGWFGHFAYLRIARHPTPRPEYWEAKLAEMAPPPPGGIPFGEVASKLTVLPPDYETLLQGKWDETREDVAKATASYEASAFKAQLAEMQSMAEAGWCGPRGLNPHEDPTAYLSAYRQWGADARCARALVALPRA